jgi:hypothetical protein
LTVYVKNGKEALVKRYGEILRGSKEFIKRISGHIDWRAMRLARTELYTSIRESAKMQGHDNPAVKEYSWNLTSGGAYECVCPDLAANSPYVETMIPDAPHANCMCQIIPVIMSREKFVDDLIDWGKGISIPYIDNWYTNTYLPFSSKL